MVSPTSRRSSRGRTAPSAHVLLERVAAGASRSGRLIHERELPARQRTFGDWPTWADPDLIGGYSALGIDDPWIHQAQAAESAWAGRHTVLATSTGSGKSLAFWLPAVTATRDSARRRSSASTTALFERRPTTLYICPTKALGADQFAALDRLFRLSGIADVRATVCDGDTPFTERRWIQDHADIVLTNPDLLHFRLLADHGRWTRLLKNLRFVVVDEAHSYRGVFGAHVAAVLRRLRRLAAHYGAHPTFILASATTAHPDQAAARLIGVEPTDITVVDVDGSPRGRHVIGLWEPPLLPTNHAEVDGDDIWLTPAPDSGFVEPEIRDQDENPDGPDAATAVPQQSRRSVSAETADLLTDLTVSGAQSLAFVRSRRSAEVVADMTRNSLAEIDGFDGGLQDQVAAYRGGYLAQERREIEARIRSGELRAVATTNALELGIDISGLDAVIIAGWPGTRASLWQQMGRAGRSGRDGLAILIARDDPLDSFLVHHPEAIFDQSVEETVFDPSNPYVLAPHLCSAAAELPLTVDDLPLFGDSAAAVLDALTERGALRRRPSGWYWTLPEQPQRMTDLRGTGGAPVQLIESATGRMLGSIDASSAPSQMHTGAVYLHQGQSYLVEHLDLDDGVALVGPHTGDYVTFSQQVTDIDVLDERARTSWTGEAGTVEWHSGTVCVRHRVVSYQRRRVPGLEVLATIPLESPEQTLETAAVWWTVPPSVLEHVGIEAADVAGALHAAEHASIGLLPLLATCDRWDIGGVSTANHADTGMATVFVYDGYPGGAGFADRGFDVCPTWIDATLAAVAECECAAGCPSCVYSPKCGNGNHPLDKAAAHRLLDYLSRCERPVPPVRAPRPNPAEEPGW